jgi:Sulphur transport
VNLELTHPLFWFAALCVGTMGFAIQRGATCTVAAVDELVSKHSARRLAAFLEASVWVAGILAVAQVSGLLVEPPAGYAVTRWTFAGGALLGLGAYVNRACVFGAIARLGSGQWAYAFTPLGYYLGCLSVEAAFGSPAQPRLDEAPLVLRHSIWVAPLFLTFVAWRVLRALCAKRDRASGCAAQRLREGLMLRIWSPHAATTVIAITFALMLLVGGVWAYTDVLAQWAQGMAGNVLRGGVFLLALLLGAMLGGVSTGRWQPTPPSAADVLRCLTGGALMAWGSLLIPGSNDGLILVGMPMLWPYAWAAFATMGASIALAQLAQRNEARPAWLGQR